MLTPKDIQNKSFKIRRVHAGYDMDEVDTFLDEITLTLNRLLIQCLRLETENKTIRRYCRTSDEGRDST